MKDINVKRVENIKRYFVGGDKNIKISFDFDRNFSPFAAGIEQDKIPELLKNKSYYKYYVRSDDSELIEFLAKTGIIRSEYNEELNKNFIPYIQDGKLTLDKEFFSPLFCYARNYDVNMDGVSHLHTEVVCGYTKNLVGALTDYLGMINIDIEFFDINKDMEKYIDEVFFIGSHQM